jgi:hypothetical protein
VATTGTATLDFGAFPGASDASIAVTGQATIASTSYVEAWIRPTATSDHTADEHLVETLKVVAGNIVSGTGFTIYGLNTNNLNEPIVVKPGANSVQQATATTVGQKIAQPGVVSDKGGSGTLVYGQWTVAWVWN